jgi:hypothetical protein
VTLCDVLIQFPFWHHDSYNLHVVHVSLLPFFMYPSTWVTPIGHSHALAGTTLGGQ